MRLPLLLSATLGGVLWLASSSRADEKTPAPAPAAKTINIPYKLTDAQHVLVRVKINGQGPFNFIIDTGAPAFIMTEAVAKKVGAKKADKMWSTFEKIELEGGLVIPEPKGIATDMFQLKGMNAMGLAGCELHGVIGYNILAQYRIEYDFTATKLAWTPVKFEVPNPKRVNKPDPKEDTSGQGGLEMMGDLMKFLAMFSGIKPNYDYRPRGFTGLELEEKEKQLVVKNVVPQSPADKAGVKVGDQIVNAKGKSVDNSTELLSVLAKLPVGTSVKFNLKRGTETKEVTIELGKGL